MDAGHMSEINSLLMLLHYQTKSINLWIKEKEIYNYQGQKIMFMYQYCILKGLLNFS